MRGDPGTGTPERRVGHRVLAAALHVVAALILAAPAPGQDAADNARPSGPPATAVLVAPVRRENVQERRRVTGELDAVARSLVATIEAGVVMERPVEEGDRVGAGHVLAVLDRRRLDIDLRRVEARIAVAKAMVLVRAAELERARHDLELLETLAARQASNPKQLTDARLDRSVAAARHDGAGSDLLVLEAEADLLRTRLADTTITAPIAGVVVRTHTECGQWVGEGDTVVEIVSVGAYEAWLDVPQRYAAAVKRPSALVHLQIDATGRSTEPRKPVVVPQVDPTSRSFSVVVLVDDPEDVLAPGMSVTGWVPTGDRAEHLTIPRDALLRNQAGFYVYVARGTAGGPAHAAPVPVIVTFETPNGVAVTASGLAEGDLVVVEGNERLFPMMPIAPAPATRDAREGP